MDYFDGLENSCYTMFKTNLYNAMTVSSIMPLQTLQTLNKVYEMAKGCLKTHIIQQGGIGTTFATVLDKMDQKPTKKENHQELQMRVIHRK